MTREEAIKVIKEHIDTYIVCHGEEDTVAVSIDNVDVEALDMAIKALEQEPCDDCISREYVIKLLENTKRTRNEITNRIYEVQSVSPQPKVGRWITWKEAGNDIPSETRFECSVCHDAAQTLCNGLDLLSTYCPNCGAKMSEIPTGQIAANGELYPWEFDDPLAEEGSDKE